VQFIGEELAFRNPPLSGMVETIYLNTE